MNTRSLARIASYSLFGLILALLVVLSSGGTAYAAGSFTVLSDICLDDQATADPDLVIPGHPGECDGSNDPDTSVSLASRFGVGLGPDEKIYTTDDVPDYNFGALVGFTPPQWGVAKGTDVPIGAIVGQLASKATLGILDVNPCFSRVAVPFEFLNASINPSDTIVAPPSGTDNRLRLLAQDGSGNGIPDGADKWPSYLNETFDESDLSKVRARLIGFNDEKAVSGLTIVLNFVIFEPGAKLSDDFTPDPRLGYPSVTILQDTTVAAAPADPINDFCSPLLSANTTFGLTKNNPNTGEDEGGKPYRTNPADGAYSFITFAAGLPDADKDGIENGLDPCPFTADPTSGEFQWDPRASELDYFAAPNFPDDNDGIPFSCDERPLDRDVAGVCCDADGDQWRNRADNCPQVSNSDNADDDSDGIGDACDILGAEITFPDGSKGSGLGPNKIDGRADPFQDPFDTILVNVIEIGSGGPPCVAAGIYSGHPNNLPFDAAGCGVGGETTTPSTEEELQQIAKEAVLASLVVGMNISAGLETVATGGSTPIVATCAKEQNGLEPVAGVDITFEIDSQPGSDADLDGQAEVTVTSDAEGLAETTLNVGSTVGEIVVSATGVDCGAAKITTVTVGQALGETSGAAGGAATGVGSLAPAIASIPAWAAIAAGLGGAGLLGSLGAFVARFIRRRRY